MEKVHIALATDENYVIGLKATAGSIAYHASKDVTLSFHILDGGITNESFDSFSQCITHLHPHIEIDRIEVNEELFIRYPEWNGNRMAYARFLLPDLLPDLSHLIYCDVDFLWLEDITKLWQLRSDSLPVTSTLDQEGTINREIAWAKKKGLPFDPSKYFCTGLSFYNLDLFRKEHIIQKVLDFLNENDDVMFPDQTSLNHVLAGRINFVDKKWQTFSICLTPELIRNPVVIHFAGDTPWNRATPWPLAVSDACLLWYAMMDEIEHVASGTTIKSRLTSWQRFYKRAFAVLIKNSIIKNIFYLCLSMLGRKEYTSYFDKFCINLHLDISEARKIVCRKP